MAAQTVPTGSACGGNEDHGFTQRKQENQQQQHLRLRAVFGDNVRQFIHLTPVGEEAECQCPIRRFNNG